MSKAIQPPRNRQTPQRRSRRNVGTAERLVSTALGIMALRRSGKRSGPGRLMSATTGSMLLGRGLTGHSMLYDRLGVSSAELEDGAGINIDASVTIKRPRQEVYEFWRDPANLSLVMSHVESVRDVGNGITHWRVRGPNNMPIEWDARVINDEPGYLIAWASVPDSPIAHAGSVHFNDAGDKGTEVLVRMRYTPERSAYAFAFAKVLNPVTEAEVAEDLRRLKHTMETGIDISSKGQPSGEPASTGGLRERVSLGTLTAGGVSR